MNQEFFCILCEERLNSANVVAGKSAGQGQDSSSSRIMPRFLAIVEAIL